jgi:hypothetical protein
MIRSPGRQRRRHYARSEDAGARAWRDDATIRGRSSASSPTASPMRKSTKSTTQGATPMPLAANHAAQQPPIGLEWSRSEPENSDHGAAGLFDVKIGSSRLGAHAHAAVRRTVSQSPTGAAAVRTAVLRGCNGGQQQQAAAAETLGGSQRRSPSGSRDIQGGSAHGIAGCVAMQSGTTIRVPPATGLRWRRVPVGAELIGFVAW